jgi:hypothetical protein
LANLGRTVLKDFLENSRPSIQAIIDELRGFTPYKKGKVRLLEVSNNQAKEAVVEGDRFFLRTSVEYSSPQLTLEEAQGIVAARLLEVCGNYFSLHNFQKPSREDVDELLRMLEEPPRGRIVPFLLNTDDVEPDRYSANPLRASIMETGQSAFPSASVKTGGLGLDEGFMKKYEGTLITKPEGETIEHHLSNCSGSYVNFVDSVKQEYLKSLSELFGIHLCLPIMRMPLTVLREEGADGLLHHIIRESHRDYGTVERVYGCMGRSMKNRTTLLTVPHSVKGFGSKRSARGKIHFDGTRLKSVHVTYQTTPLYPNDIDSKDVSIAVAEDDFEVEADKLTNYDYRETPSSPQFILYSLASPEDAAIWHGIGESGASQLVKSYTSTHVACKRDGIIDGLEEFGMSKRVPVQFNLIPEKMWVHPVHGTIDTSVGSVEKLEDLARRGMWVEALSMQEYAR